MTDTEQNDKAATFMVTERAYRQAVRCKCDDSKCSRVNYILSVF